MTDKLILTPLEKASGLLSVALQQPKTEFTRDAVIQRFEYTYELCWKFILRDMIESEGSEAVTRLNRKDLFRLAADKGLIADPLSWFSYHKARNETSHNYNETKAEETYRTAKTFAPDARDLLNILKDRHAGS